MNYFGVGIMQKNINYYKPNKMERKRKRERHYAKLQLKFNVKE